MPGSASTVTGLRVFLQYLAFIDVLESFRKGLVHAVGIMILRQDSLVSSNKIPKNDNFCTNESCRKTIMPTACTNPFLNDSKTSINARYCRNTRNPVTVEALPGPKRRFLRRTFLDSAKKDAYRM